MVFTEGLVEIHAGEGMAKPSPALGLSLRAADHDLKVSIIQLIRVDLTIGT